MTLRIGGLATGMDIDSCVSQLMKAHRMPVDKTEQKKHSLEWQRDAYREMNTKIKTFHDTLFDYRLSSTYSAKEVAVTGNSEAASAAAKTNAVDGSYTIEVKQLAEAATNRSYRDIRANESSFDPDETLLSQKSQLNMDSLISQVYKFKINGKEITVDTHQDTLTDVIKRINQETNVSAFYDDQTGKVSFMAKNTGLVHGENEDQGHIQFEDTTGSFLENLLYVETGREDSAAAGKDAELVINGLETTRSSNTFEINGLEVTLHAVSENNTKTHINVRNDIDQIVESVTSFIDAYNEILKTLQDKVTEERYREFHPLTSEQKEEMSEREVEMWEEKAKSGLVRNDPILTGAINSMRNAISSIVDTGSSQYTTLSSLGIETGKYFEHGKLYLNDENKLREALEKEPDIVQRLFATDTEGNEKGIIERMYDSLDTTLKDLNSKAGMPNALTDDSFLTKQISNLSDSLDRQNERLLSLEDRYYRQFTAMEKAINMYNSQSMYLASQFGGNM